MEWLQGHGWLDYNPVRHEIKKTRNADEWWLVLNVPGDICKYYSWFVLRERGITLQHPVWKPHVTVLNGRVPVATHLRKFWKKYQGKKINFEYTVDVSRNWKFWTIDVRSDELIEIRKELGFFNDPKLHLTVGREHEVEPNLEIVRYGLQL